MTMMIMKWIIMMMVMMTDNMTFNLKAPNYFQGWVFSEIHINPIIAKLLYVKKF